MRDTYNGKKLGLARLVEAAPGMDLGIDQDVVQTKPGVAGETVAFGGQVLENVFVRFGFSFGTDEDNYALPCLAVDSVTDCCLADRPLCFLFLELGVAQRVLKL